MTIKKNLFLLSSIFICSLSAGVVLLGDNTTAPSFSFNVLPHVLEEGGEVLYVGRNDATNAGDSTKIKNFSISGINSLMSTFTALAPSTVVLNGAIGQSNPLHGEKISLLSLLGGTPLVVRADALQHLYWISSNVGATLTTVASALDVKDAQGAQGVDGAITSGIVGIAGNAYYAFAAVKKNGGTFGESGGGIALFQKTGKQLLEQKASVSNDSGIKAFSIHGGLDQIKIGSDAVVTANSIDMHWSNALGRLYIAVQVAGASGATDGARAVFMAYTEVDVQGVVTLHIKELVPAAAINGNTQIIGAKEANADVRIHKLRVMQTSTGLHYLIVVGNANSASTSDKTVYALPLVDTSKASGQVSAEHGTIASKLVDPTSFFSSTTPSVFLGKGFQTQATTNLMLPTITDTQALVGRGVAPQTITDIRVYKDVVFVSTGSDGTNEPAGVFYSYALFNQYGAIKGWSDWQRLHITNNASNGVFGIDYAPSYGKMYTLEGTGVNALDTVITSTWDEGDKDGLLGGTTSDASVGLAAMIRSTFSPYGLQGLFDFPRTHGGFTTLANSKLSIMIATGYKKIMLIETGRDADSGTIFNPNIGDFNGSALTFSDGSISTAPSSGTKAITISGGVLNSLKSITSAAIVSDGTYGGYLVVGGIGGLAVLRTAAGAGWPVSGLEKAFNGISNDKSFVKIGSYKNVRALISAGSNLYVLTDKTFDRIASSQLNGSLVPIVLATPKAIGIGEDGSFSDGVVSAPFALLATSGGLRRVGNGSDISTATDVASLKWTSVVLPEGYTSVTRLYPLSPTPLATNVADTDSGGMIYVLSGSVGYKASSIHRFALADASAGVTDDTYRVIQDRFIEGKNSAFAHLGVYRNFIWAYSALMTLSRSKYITTPPLFARLPLQISSGFPYLNRRLINIPFVFGDDAKTIRAVVRNSASGGALLTGDFGVRLYE